MYGRAIKRYQDIYERIEGIWNVSITNDNKFIIKINFLFSESRFFQSVILGNIIWMEDNIVITRIDTNN